MLVGLNKARQQGIQAMTVWTKTSWDKHLHFHVAVKANHAKMMVIAGKRLTAARAAGKFFSCDPEYIV